MQSLDDMIEEYSEFQFNLDLIARATHDFSDKLGGNMVLGFNYNSLKTTGLGGTSLDFILPMGQEILTTLLQPILA